MEISEFARRNSVSISDVWRKVRRGELIARNIRGQFEVYGKEDEEPPIESAKGPLRQGASAGPAPEVSANHPAMIQFEPAFNPPVPAVVTAPAQSTEIALLLDHLSLAKDENREILKMATETINQMTNMTKEALASKEELLRQRTSDLDLIKSESQKKDEQIRRLKQELEDIQMLNKSLQTS